MDNPIVDFAGQKLDFMAVEAYALGHMRGKPGVVQFYGCCLGPADANPQQGVIVTE